MYHFTISSYLVLIFLFVYFTWTCSMLEYIVLLYAAKLLRFSY